MRILLSRTDRVGDLILSTPAIASIRRRFPHAHITLSCSSYNAVVVEKSPDVDAVARVLAAWGTVPRAAAELGAEANVREERAAEIAGALTARGLHKVSRVARTVADLMGAEQVGEEHVCDALTLRTARSTVAP